MNDYLFDNWPQVKQVLLELENLGVEECLSHIQDIQDLRLQMEVSRFFTTNNREILEQPLVRWLTPLAQRL